jgi:hypothetical protein
VVPESDGTAICPLCLAQLKSDEQKALQAELAELKAHADAAEKKLADVCAAIEKQLGGVLTAELRKHHDMLKSMAPKEAYASASLLRFAQEEPFKSMLVGIAKVTTEACLSGCCPHPLHLVVRLEGSVLVFAPNNTLGHRV